MCKTKESLRQQNTLLLVFYLDTDDACIEVISDIVSVVEISNRKRNIKVIFLLFNYIRVRPYFLW